VSTTAPPRRPSLDGRALARSAGILTVARPLGALAFTASLVLLPRWGDPAVVDDVTWAYFAYLFLTSILNLGLERLAGPWAGRHPTAPLGGLMGPVLTVRLLTLPLGGLALWVLLRALGVHLDGAVVSWTAVWIAAGQVGAFLYAVLRVEGRVGLEARTSIALRSAQAVTVVVGAAEGWSAGRLIGGLAILEVVTTALLLVATRVRPTANAAAVRALPWGLLAQFTALEVVGFLYLRVDTLLVTRLLDPSTGATYTLLYRVIDAAVAVLTPFVLVVYPQAALRAAAGEALTGLRRIGLRLVPALATAAAVVAVLLVPLLLDAVPRYADHGTAVRLLVAAIPLLAWNAVELHLRAAEGRTRQVLLLSLIVLATAVIVSVPAIELWGLRGAAAGVVAAEAVQSALLGIGLDHDDRSSVRWVLGASAVLVAIALAWAASPLGGIAAVALLAVSARRSWVLTGELR
jgi:O-antigen/teichoic acid export membrane protein